MHPNDTTNEIFPWKKSDTLKERFLQRVERDALSGCWFWQGDISNRGYGRLMFKGIRHQAHRLSYEIYNGPIPEDMYVCHNCPDGDNPACVNPAHLFLGTQADNMADMIAKGRDNHASGSAHGIAKLTEESVRQIRQQIAEGRTQADIARTHGVCKATISHIACGRIWTTVE